METFASSAERWRFIGVIAGVVAFAVIIAVLSVFELKQPVSVVPIAIPAVVGVGVVVWAALRIHAARSGKPSVTRH